MNEYPRELYGAASDEISRLRRGLQASQQAVLDKDVELSTAAPMAAVAHTLCSVFLNPETNGADVLAALSDLLHVHQQQTPSPPEVPPGAPTLSPYTCPTSGARTWCDCNGPGLCKGLPS